MVSELRRSHMIVLLLSLLAIGGNNADGTGSAPSGCSGVRLHLLQDTRTPFNVTLASHSSLHTLSQIIDKTVALSPSSLFSIYTFTDAPYLNTEHSSIFRQIAFMNSSDAVKDTLNSGFPEFGNGTGRNSNAFTVMYHIAANLESIADDSMKTVMVVLTDGVPQFKGCGDMDTDGGELDTPSCCERDKETACPGSDEIGNTSCIDYSAKFNYENNCPIDLPTLSHKLDGAHVIYVDASDVSDEVTSSWDYLVSDSQLQLDDFYTIKTDYMYTGLVDTLMDTITQIICPPPPSTGKPTTTTTTQPSGMSTAMIWTCAAAPFVVILGVFGSNRLTGWPVLPEFELEQEEETPLILNED